jgi:hypothetical protein
MVSNTIGVLTPDEYELQGKWEGQYRIDPKSGRTIQVYILCCHTMLIVSF